MPVERPPRAPSRITQEIAAAILTWIEARVGGVEVPRLVDLYLEEEVHGDTMSALIDLEERYGLRQGELTDQFSQRLRAYADAHRRRTEDEPANVGVLPDEATLIRRLPEVLTAAAFLFCLPEPEFLTAIEQGAYRLAMQGRSHPDVFLYLEKVFRTRGLPYTASRSEGIRWVGEPAVREQAIDPALSVLAEPSLVTARAEFEKALVHLRGGEFKDAGRWAGDAVETTMAMLLENHGHPQPQTPHGTDLVQAIKLFDQLKSTRVGVLNEDRDHALIFAPMKVRNACGHGGGAQPTPQDPAYVEAGVAAAAIAITYLASKFK